MPDDDKQNPEEQTEKKYLPWLDPSTFRHQFNLLNEAPIVGYDSEHIANIAKLSSRGGNRIGTDAVYVEVFDPKRTSITIHEKGVELSDKEAEDPPITGYFTDDDMVEGSNLDRHESKHILRGWESPTGMDTHIITDNPDDQLAIELTPAHTNVTHDNEARYLPDVTFNNTMLKAHDNRMLGTRYVVKSGQTLDLTMPLPEKVLKPLSKHVHPEYFEENKGFDDDKALVTTTSIAHNPVNRFTGDKRYEEDMPIRLNVSFHPEEKDLFGRGTLMPSNTVNLPNGTKIRMQKGAKLKLHYVDDKGQLIHELDYTATLGETKENPKKGAFETENIGIVPAEDQQLFANARDVIRQKLMEREAERAALLNNNTKQYDALKKELSNDAQKREDKPTASVDGVDIYKDGNVLYVNQQEFNNAPITIRGEALFVGIQANQNIRNATYMIDEEDNRPHSQPLEDALALLKETEPTINLKGIDFIVVKGSEQDSLLTIAGDGNTYMRHTPLRVIHDEGHVEMEIIGNDKRFTSTHYDNHPITLERPDGEPMRLTMPPRFTHRVDGGRGANVQSVEDGDSKVTGTGLEEKEAHIIAADKQYLEMYIPGHTRHRVAKNIFAGQLFDLTTPDRYLFLKGGADGRKAQLGLQEQMDEQEKDEPRTWKFLPKEKMNPQPKKPPKPQNPKPIQMVSTPQELKGVPDDVLDAAVTAAKLRGAETIPTIAKTSEPSKGASV